MGAKLIDRSICWMVPSILLIVQSESKDPSEGHDRDG